MEANKMYRMATALINFTAAFSELAAASKALPDLDVSELYPFYLLDYEKIDVDVKQWCLHHASKLLGQVPDKVPNSACAQCPWLYAGLDFDGQCKGRKTTGCNLFPQTVCQRSSAAAFLSHYGFDPTKYDDGVLQAYYVKTIKEVNNEARLRTSVATGASVGATADETPSSSDSATGAIHTDNDSADVCTDQLKLLK